MRTPDQLLTAAHTLASAAATAGVLDNQLAFVLTHLKRHRDVKCTHSLLEQLVTSPFADRSAQAKSQLSQLQLHVRTSLRNVTDWEEAAAIVGWARRLVPFYRLGTTGARGDRQQRPGSRPRAPRNSGPPGNTARGASSRGDRPPRR